MQILRKFQSSPRTGPTLSPPLAPYPKDPSAKSDSPSDTVSLGQGLPSAWVDVDPMPATRPDSPPPALERPVLFLHGFNGRAERWGELTDWLTSGESPVNRDGGIISADRLDRIDGDANLFSLRLSRPYNSVETNVEELKATVEALCRATGSAEVDIVAHSLGGLNTRYYLQDPDEKVGKLVMLGTPNKGSQLANLERIFRENFGYPISPPVDDPEVRRVLEQLSVDRIDRQGRPENPFLNRLNENWNQQRASADMLIIAGSGVPTVGGRFGVTPFGDGVVTRSSSRMPEVENRTSWFRTHSGIQNSAAVMEATAAFLTGQPLPTSEDIFDSADDAARAARLNARDFMPSPVVEKVDLERVRQAAQHPILDPAFQFGLSLSVLAALMGGPKEGLPTISLDVRSNQGQASTQAAYRIDLQDPQSPIAGHGSLQNHPFQETARLEEGRIEWRGTSDTALTLTPSEEETALHLRGTLQGVSADLTSRIEHDAQGILTGLTTKGTLNGELFEMHSAIDFAELLQQRDVPVHHTAMHVEGLIEGQAIEKTYQVGLKRVGSGLDLTASGVGLNAGQEQQVRVDIKIRDRR